MNIRLSAIKPGLALVLFGLIFGIALGVGFGINEDLFQDFIAEGVTIHPDVHDAKSQDKIWRYAQRAHFHSTGIAAFSIGLLLLVAISNLSQKIKKSTSVLIGLGFLYPFSWLTMFLLAPSIGRSAAHGHIVTELFTYVGVGGLVIGFFVLVGNIFFGFLADSSET
ncbi:MAG: hypothetical protein COB61_005335 [Thiotrichales bacterium]|nr:hypothetical protein [Thiotrichales bacterium]